LFAQDQPTFRADATLVTVPVLVTDSLGKPVQDLSPNEFRLFDNGVPCDIRNVSRQEALPLTIAIIVDISESQRAFLSEHQSAVDGFLLRLLRPRRSRLHHHR